MLDGEAFNPTALEAALRRAPAALSFAHSRRLSHTPRNWRLHNNDHKHSGIRYVSPAQRHAGQDRDILAARHEVYVQAKADHPRRWARHTRNWDPITVVTLNPERVKAAENAAHAKRAAA